MPYVIIVDRREFVWATRGGKRKRYELRAGVNEATVWYRLSDIGRVIPIVAERFGVPLKNVAAVEVEIVPEKFIRNLMAAAGIRTVAQDPVKKCGCTSGCKNWDCDRL